jgi:phosphoglucosamine mutase
MANEGLKTHLESLGKTLVRTPVGDKYVAAYLAEHNLPLGAEPSGHVIVRDFLGTSDGVFVALKVLESMLLNKNNDLVTFTKFPQVLVSVHVKNKKDLLVPPLSSIIEDYKKMLKDGRMIVRFSGTEHVLRVMVESSDEEIAHTVARDLAQALQLALE